MFSTAFSLPAFPCWKSVLPENLHGAIERCTDVVAQKIYKRIKNTITTFQKANDIRGLKYLCNFFHTYFCFQHIDLDTNIYRWFGRVPNPSTHPRSEVLLYQFCMNFLIRQGKPLQPKLNVIREFHQNIPNRYERKVCTYSLKVDSSECLCSTVLSLFHIYRIAWHKKAQTEKPITKKSADASSSPFLKTYRLLKSRAETKCGGADGSECKLSRMWWNSSRVTRLFISAWYIWYI